MDSAGAETEPTDRQMRRTVGGGLWEERDGAPAEADAAWTGVGMCQTEAAGSVTAHAPVRVAAALGAWSAWQQLGLWPVNPVLQQSCVPAVGPAGAAGTDIAQ